MYHIYQALIAVINLCEWGMLALSCMKSHSQSLKADHIYNYVHLYMKTEN